MYTTTTVSEHPYHCNPRSFREGPGTQAKWCARAPRGACDKAGTAFPSLQAPPPLTAEAFCLIWFFYMVQTYSARILKYLQAGECCPPGSHNTSPAVGTRGCVHNKRELDRDSSAP